MSDLRQQMNDLTQRSRDAARALAKMDSAAKNKLLLEMADNIEKSDGYTKAANARVLGW